MKHRTENLSVQLVSEKQKHEDLESLSDDKAKIGKKSLYLKN